MIHHTTTHNNHWSVGCSTSTGQVLAQLMEDGNQARIPLTPTQAEAMASELVRYAQKIREAIKAREDFRGVAITPPPALAGKHGFVGYQGHIDASQYGWAAKTGFSLGVFAWQPKANGKGLKPGRVKIRVKGFFVRAPEVYAKARELCERLDAGESFPQKSISV